MLKMLSILVGLAAIGVGLLITYKLQQVPEMPKLDLNKWWGTGARPAKDDTSIRPFKIEFNDTMIQDLKQRLKNKRPLTRTLDGMQSQYGINIDYLEKVLSYWTDKYDFKKREDLLNQFPHYKTRIQGLDIHFIRVKPQVADGVKVLPLLLLPGWPSSSKEYIKIIPMLTKPREGYDFVFEVVAADLPGFGFSEGTTKPGLNQIEMAIIMRNLMLRLGFDKFYIHGGDWGGQVATQLVTVFPENVLGFHTNMPLPSRHISFIKLLLGSLVPWLTPHSERIYPLTKTLGYLFRESGYFHQQATKPDSVGVALADSPAGLAAYIIEKIAVVTHREQLDTPHGGIENLDLDDVIDKLVIVWANNCVMTSMRLYMEGFANPIIFTLGNIPTKVPFAATNFRHEILYNPDWILRDKFPNLVYSAKYDFGGHFAALENPELLTEDVFASVKEFIKFRENEAKS